MYYFQISQIKRKQRIPHDVSTYLCNLHHGRGELGASETIPHVFRNNFVYIYIYIYTYVCIYIIICIYIYYIYVYIYVLYVYKLFAYISVYICCLLDV